MIKAIVHKTGRKATMVLMSHWAPPATRAWVIALAISSGFICVLLFHEVCSIEWVNSHCLPARKAVLHFFGSLCPSSGDERIARGDRSHDGEQGDRDVADADSPGGI